MKMQFGAILLALLATNCANVPQKNKPEMETYAESLSAKIKPIWAEEVKTRIKHLANHGLAPIPLEAPKNEVFLKFSIATDGAISNIETLKKSKFAFLNKAAVETLTKASPVTTPPESCVKNGQCVIHWKFVIEQ
jgi:TonB family protein